MDDGNKQEAILQIINELIVHNQDAQETYGTAATAVENRYLTQVFTDYAQQRGQFALELVQLVDGLGNQHYEGAATEPGNLSGTLQRVWINLNAVLRNGDQAILAQCVRGEKNLLQTYSEALKQEELEELPDEDQALIQHQVSLIRTELDHLQALKDALPDL